MPDAVVFWTAVGGGAALLAVGLVIVGYLIRLNARVSRVDTRMDWWNEQWKTLVTKEDCTSTRMTCPLAGQMGGIERRVTKDEGKTGALEVWLGKTTERLDTFFERTLPEIRDRLTRIEAGVTRNGKARGNSGD